MLNGKCWIPVTAYSDEAGTGTETPFVRTSR